MIPIQNTWGTEALSWYSCWYSVTEAAMYFVLSWVGSGPWHRPNIRGCVVTRCSVITVTPLSAGTISSSLTEHQYPIRLSSRRGQHGLSLWGWWVAPLSTKTITETLHQDDQRTHIPRLVSLPCRCTTLLPGTLSKMSINKMTFNRKVKIGSLLTAWHRYLVIDLYITIPNLREAEREPSTHSAVHRPEKLLLLDCCPFGRIKKEVVWVSPRMIIMAVVLIALNITN